MSSNCAPSLALPHLTFMTGTRHSYSITNARHHSLHRSWNQFLSVTDDVKLNMSSIKYLMPATIIAHICMWRHKIDIRRNEKADSIQIDINTGFEAAASCQNKSICPACDQNHLICHLNNSRIYDRHLTWTMQNCEYILKKKKKKIHLTVTSQNKTGIECENAKERHIKCIKRGWWT